MSRDYYAKKLSASRLQQAYALAGPRVERYLRSEIEHLAGFVEADMRVLELGCGYGRILARLAPLAGESWGVDNAYGSLQMARTGIPGVWLALMDVARLGLKDLSFDLVIGAQNFISACKTEPQVLLKEALRVTRPGGLVLLSSYAAEFWPHRLEWFRAQAEAGFLGPIDESATGNGVIVCHDGFKATTFSPGQFEELCRSCRVRAEIYKVDDSSVFCRVRKA